MFKGSISIKSIVFGFVLFIVVMGVVPLLLSRIMPLRVMLFSGMVFFVYFILSLITGFITGVIAKKSEMANGIALGILLILFDVFVFSLQVVHDLTFSFHFSDVFSALIMVTGVVAGSALRKYTKNFSYPFQTKKEILINKNYVNKQIIKFIITSVLFIIAVYWAALKLDTFGTGLVAFIPVLYFIAKGLKSLWQLIKRQEVRTNLVIGIGSIFALVVMLHCCFDVSDRGLRDLTIQRKQTLNELRPILLKYKEEHGFYPNKLQDLTPKYLQAVPLELLNDGKEDIYKRIVYEVCEGEARFIFSQVRGPDSRVTYHVSDNRYEYDQ